MYIFVTILLLSLNLFGAGELKDGKVSTYLVGALQDEASVTSTLKGAGFEVLTSFPVDAQGELTTIVFTNDTLKTMANKKNRGHAAILRVLINKKDAEIRITNPLYFGKAFLQDDYDGSSFEAILAKLNGAFANLQDSGENMKFSKLEKYHFMFGMPYYQEMDTVSKGDTASLVQKAQSGGNIVFTLKLSENRVLLGYKLSDKTSNFVSTIGTKNALVLPYTILVEDNKAKTLAGKYYIAVSYPQLKMGQFMKIATIPGAIKTECKSAF
jgi:hypothetical protein